MPALLYSATVLSATHDPELKELLAHHPAFVTALCRALEDVADRAIAALDQPGHRVSDHRPRVAENVENSGRSIRTGADDRPRRADEVEKAARVVRKVRSWFRLKLGPRVLAAHGVFNTADAGRASRR